MKSKALTAIGLGLWFTLIVASRVDAETAEPVVIPEEIQYWCEYYGDRYEISPELIEAMAWHESRCIPSAQSEDKRCKGILQVNPYCHQERMERLNARNVFGVPENIRIGTDYLAELIEEEGGKIEPALARYNGQNEQAVQDARNGKPWKYVRKILETAEELKKGGK